MIEPAIHVLYTITVGLEAPVVLGVLAALVWALVELGWFLREWFDRRRKVAEAPSELRSTSALALSSGDPEALLHEMEFRASRRLARVRIGLRIGPMLGLMGTLIPMGPALKGVSDGNLAAMSDNLIIAFSTTVVGLLVGALCYVILTARRYWYARDIADVERLTFAESGEATP